MKSDLQLWREYEFNGLNVEIFIDESDLSTFWVKQCVTLQLCGRTGKVHIGIAKNPAHMFYFLNDCEYRDLYAGYQIPYKMRNYADTLKICHAVKQHGYRKSRVKAYEAEKFFIQVNQDFRREFDNFFRKGLRLFRAFFKKNNNQVKNHE